MFIKPSPKKENERGRMFRLVEKRNKQFSRLIAKARDVAIILKLHIGLNEVYEKHFPHKSATPTVGKLLNYSKYNDFFNSKKASEALHLTRKEVSNKLSLCVKLGWIKWQRKGNNYKQCKYFYLTAEGKYTINAYNKECTKVISGLLSGRSQRKMKLLKKTNEPQ